MSDLTAVAEAAARLRDEPHHVTFHETGWELEHNLRCRVIGMRHCSIYDSLKKLDGSPVDFGRYRVYDVGAGTLVYEPETSDDPAADLLDALTGAGL